MVLRVLGRFLVSGVFVLGILGWFLVLRVFVLRVFLRVFVFRVFVLHNGVPFSALNQDQLQIFTHYSKLR